MKTTIMLYENSLTF